MTRLAMLMFSLISPTLMGTAIIVVLVAGYGTLKPILLAAAIGFIAAIPASWIVAKMLYGQRKPG